MQQHFDYDFAIVGSGFGGSVAGLRLVEKGYRVLMLEKGREFRPDNLPKTNWNLRRWMWLPQLGMRGFFRMTILRHITVLSGVAVGGGSITYAATLPTPGDDFFRSGDWAGLLDWKQELAPFYRKARQMLGVARNPVLGDSDRALLAVATARGEPEAFEPTEVGIFFGKAKQEVKDPYFDGEGPARSGCQHCGGCMLGCRFGAKNTLDMNYLYLARKQGLELRAQTEVTSLHALEGGGYALSARRARGAGGGTSRFTAGQVVLAGGVLGTLSLLLRMQALPTGLPKLSKLLGGRVRTNSESFIGIITRKSNVDLSSGIAIGSIYHCAPGESVEPVRYSSGSGFFRVLMAPHVEGVRTAVRLWRLVATCLRNPYKILRALTVWNAATKMSILMYMRSCEGTLRFRWSRFGLRTEREQGPAPVSYIPEASQLARESATLLEGVPFALVQETIFNIPTTAHVLGGAVIGKDAEHGVIDTNQRVFGYPGLYIMDGSAMSANPGVNPSLTITALAERAVSQIPPKA